jgi:sortase (surface protein transpeptidase)
MLYTQKNIYTYTVREQRTVEDDSMFVLGQSSNPQLTLITCSNWDTNMRLYLNRLVVFADLKSVEPVRGASQGN